ncbi:MAG: Ig-like domain-containing protein [Solirubrobacterales bacterium]|nr:Ig-like domain-containing protein [Solirubrobacterales bacterium]
MITATERDVTERTSDREIVRKAVLLAVLVLSAVAFLATSGAGRAEAAAPVIMNTANAPGPSGMSFGKNWLENWTPSDGFRQVRVTLTVKHDPGRRVTGLRIDDDYNGNDDTGSATLRAVTPQQPTVAGGFDYSRVTLTFDVSNSNTGLTCPGLFGGDGVRSRTLTLRIRAQLDDGTQTATSNSDMRLIRADCSGKDDLPRITARSQDQTSINVGQSVNFTFTADDSDAALTTWQEFGGVINWRMRRLSDNTVTAEQSWGTCQNSDNASKTMPVTFNRRGTWVVEAKLRNVNNSCGDPAPGDAGYYMLGTVDVNSPASAGPNVTLNATRPQLNGNTTLSATFSDATADQGEGGRGQFLEWDLDENAGNGVGGFEATNLGDWLTGLTSPFNRNLNTTGFSPGLHSVRVRVTDNGAMSAADNIRRQKIATTQFLVDTPPVALPDSKQTETGSPVSMALAGTDVDGDSLTYSISTPPAHGSISGSGASRTYTPDPGYAGLDSFVFEANDGYGGTGTATVNLRVDPDLDPFTGPSGTVDSRGGQIEFGSHATDPVGATFECQLDSGSWDPCTSPFSVTDLPDGSHTLRTRVTANGLTNPAVGEASWTVDAFPKVTIDDQPDALTDQTSAAVDFTLSEDGATPTPTSECRIDSLDWVPCGSGESWEDLDDGVHTIEIRATDAFGKQFVRSVSWTVLTDGGSTTIDTPYPASFTRDTTAEVSFSGSANTDHTECSLDGGPWQACASPTTVNGLTEGEHTLRVRSVNALGKASDQPASITWTVDRTPAVVEITAGPSGPTPNAPAAFSFESSESFSTFECKLDGGDYAPCSSPFDLPNGLADGYHSFRVAAIDRAGNRSLAPQRDFKLMSSAAAAEITSGPAEGSTTKATAASFGISAAAPVPGFECKLDGGDYGPCSDPAAVTGLTDGSHTFSVRAIDEVGNRGAAAIRNWTVDTTAPSTEITAGPSGISGSAGAEFRFASSEAGSSFECSLDDAAWQACNSPLNLTGLTEGPHGFRVRATDQAGNTDSSPDSRAWTVDSTAAVPDPPLPDPETQPCDFRTPRERCGDPYLVGSARSSFRKKRGKGSIRVDIDSGAVALKRVVARMPSGLETRTFSGAAGRKVGTVTLTGSSRSRVTLKLPRRVKKGNLVAGSKGGAKITLNQRSLVLTNLPPGTTGVKIRLKSSRGLGISASVCGTKTWRAVLTDTGSVTRLVSAQGDNNCVRKGTR